MRIVIGGAGEVGRGVAKNLRSEGRDVVLIASDPVAIKEAQALDVLVVQGDARVRSDLLEAEIEKAEVYIAATQRDELNMLSCALARDIHAKTGNGRSLTTIARIHDAELVEQEDDDSLLRWSGVNHTVCSDLLVINDLKAGLKGSGMEEVLSISDDAWITVVKVLPEASQLVESTPAEAVDNIDGLPLIFAAKEVGGNAFIPKRETIIKPNMKLAFATMGEHTFRRILTACGHQPPQYKDKPRILIFGATRLGKQIAESYVRDGSRVTVISESLEEANELAAGDYDNFNLIDSIYGNPLDQDLLYELDIQDHDIAIAALADDHRNMAATMQAAELGVARCGMVLDDSQLAQVAHRIGHTTAISRRKTAITYILQHVHKRVPGKYTLLNSMKGIISMSAKIESGSNLVGKQIASLEKKGCRVAFIDRQSRNGATVSHRGSELQFFKEGDRLVLFTTERQVTQVENKLLGG